MPKTEEKKPKLSKKERKRLEAEQKALEEQKLREEEEKARIEAEKKRIEDEQRLAAERAQFRKEELERLNDEYRMEQFYERERRQKIDNYFDTYNFNKDWETFVKCSEFPNINDRRDIYNFITTMTDDTHIKLEDVQEQCTIICRFILELHYQSLFSVPFDDLFRIYTPLSMISDLIKLLFRRIDWGTANLLEHLHEYTASGTSELKLNYGNEIFNYGLWCNLGQKVLRMKQVKFDDIGLFIEMPKQLAVMKIALRVLICGVDIITQFYLKEHQLIIDTNMIDNNEITPLQHKLAAQDHNKWRKTAMNRDYVKSVNNIDYNLSKLSYNELPNELKLISLQRIQNLFEWHNCSQVSKELYPFGGIIYVEILELPEPLKNLKSWECQKVDSFWTQVLVYQYPPLNATSQVIQSVKVRYTVPNNIYVKEMPRIGYFSFESQQWLEDGFSDVEFDVVKRELSFSTTHLGVLTMLGRSSADFPYNNWRVYCDELKKCFVEIESPRFTYIFKVMNEGVEFISPQLPELSHLYKKIFRSSDLLCELKRSGINLIPNKSDEKYVIIPDEELNRNIELKDYNLEMDVYKQIPEISYAFECSRSSWNSTSPINEIVMCVVESSLGNNTENKSLAMFVADDDSPSKLRCFLPVTNEESESFDSEKLIGRSHNYLRQSITYISTEDGVSLIHDNNVLLEENLRQLLCLLRPLSFTI